MGEGHEGGRARLRMSSRSGVLSAPDCGRVIGAGAVARAAGRTSLPPA